MTIKMPDLPINDYIAKIVEANGNEAQIRLDVVMLDTDINQAIDKQ